MNEADALGDPCVQEHDIFSGLGREGEESATPRTVEQGKAAAEAEREEAEEERVVELSPEEFERQLKLQRMKEAAEEQGSTAAADQKEAPKDAAG